jgi:hypothetical protein
MPRKPVSPLHSWVGAALIPLDGRAAAQGNRHGRVRGYVDEDYDVLDVYCATCRRSYDDVADVPCEAAEGNSHLIGGPIGTRKKRVHDDHDCTLFGCDPSPAELAELRRLAAGGVRHHVG